MLEEEASLLDSGIAMVDEQRRAQFVAVTVYAAGVQTHKI
jgi:hypothetical protein